MKFDFETSVHDKVTRKRSKKNSSINNEIQRFSIRCSATKTDSMRQIIQHIDERHWRTLDYFRMLQKSSKPPMKIPITEHHVLVNTQHLMFLLLVFFDDLLHRVLTWTINTKQELKKCIKNLPPD